MNNWLSKTNNLISRMAGEEFTNREDRTITVTRIS